MKIAIFTDSFHPQINGVVRSITDLAKGMTDKGHKIIIVAPEYKEHYVEFIYKDIEIYRLPSVDANFYQGFKWSAIMHKPTFKKIRDAQIDVVHFMTPVTVSVFGILVGKLLRKPIIGTYHTFISELSYVRQLFPHAGLGAQKFAWKYTNAFYNRAHLITTPTANARLELINNHCRVEVEAVSNGIKLDSFNNSKALEIKEKYNPEGELVLYVGRLAPEKNMTVLLEAFKELCETDLTTKLIIVGGGPSLEECREYVLKNCLDKRVIFTGLIPLKEFKNSGILGASKMFVTASTTETQSITVLESEANGLPCIGPNAKGIPNVIENGVNGFVVKPNNSSEITRCMKILLEDDDLYNKMSKKAVESVQKHDFNTILDGWEERYKKMSEIHVSRLRRPRHIHSLTVHP